MGSEFLSKLAGNKCWCWCYLLLGKLIDLIGCNWDRREHFTQNKKEGTRDRSLKTNIARYCHTWDGSTVTLCDILFWALLAASFLFPILFRGLLSATALNRIVVLG